MYLCDIDEKFRKILNLVYFLTVVKNQNSPKEETTKPKVQEASSPGKKKLGIRKFDYKSEVAVDKF